MGAWTVYSRREVGRVDRSRVVESVIIGSATYATGGDTLNPKSLGLRAITQLVESTHSAGGSGPGAMTSGKPAFVSYRQTGASVDLAGTPVAPLLRIHDAQGVEVANASNNSTRYFQVRAMGY